MIWGKSLCVPLRASSTACRQLGLQRRGLRGMLGFGEGIMSTGFSMFISVLLLNRGMYVV